MPTADPTIMRKNSGNRNAYNELRDIELTTGAPNPSGETKPGYKWIPDPFIPNEGEWVLTSDRIQHPQNLSQGRKYNNLQPDEDEPVF